MSATMANPRRIVRAVTMVRTISVCNTKASEHLLLRVVQASRGVHRTSSNGAGASPIQGQPVCDTGIDPLLEEVVQLCPYQRHIIVSRQLGAIDDYPVITTIFIPAKNCRHEAGQHLAHVEIARIHVV